MPLYTTILKLKFNVSDFFHALAFSGGAAVKRQKNGYEWMKSVHFEKWGWGLKNVTTDRPTL